MKLPILSGEELAKILIKSRGYAVRSRKGSHISLIHQNLPPITIPLHRELKKGLLRHIIKLVGLSDSEIR
ncbi:MAG: type II toxin-antitoxin system HicA family toxin [Candidatus Micrarchaeia archaeon]